ncbi:hypothetical protein OSB04_008381 [Centaurea solstitialis]|uniref:Gnk2-homologous domain-containing protein n=1 Tax=Centaurea solstitialis TaxID=347529 RepID=A0AA38TZF2_9ASTR|nr:hypothetical protein OSB04_008381 [Centaurea solstitialis]
MLILSNKQLLWFSFVFIYLTNSISLAQPEFISYDCNEASNYTRNSTYESYLNTSLSILPTTNSGNGFYSYVSIFQNNETLYSVGLCRGDVEQDVCATCLDDSIVKLRQLCPNQKDAIGYYDYCMLKYSNTTILTKTGIRFYVFLANQQNASDIDRFNRALRPLMNQLIRDAAGGDRLLKFATGNTTALDFPTIYALVQCTPDLSRQQCSDCLEDAVNQFAHYYGNSGKVGGITFLPMCNFRYEIYQFYNGSTLVIPAPPSLPPPRPPPPGTSVAQTFPMKL